MHGFSHGISVRLRVNEKFGLDPTVISGPPPGVPKQWTDIRLIANRLYKHRFRPGNPSLHSTAWLPSGNLRELNDCYHPHDIIHLHWLGDWMLSIEEIGKLRLPVVWTMHDQWTFSGAEHYVDYTRDAESAPFVNRYQTGYSCNSRPPYESGPDINRRTWLRKRRAWRHPMHIICPSSWMADCARQSLLMADWPIHIIPYPINLDTWAPVDKKLARKLLNLPLESPLILYGATGGAADPRKGGELLFEALHYLSHSIHAAQLADLELLVFGQERPEKPPYLDFPIHYLGAINDELRLRLLYASADVFVIPSRLDNLPNTGLEAHACGTPVVAFRTSGLPDIVDDNITGILAEAFDAGSLAKAIEAILADWHRQQQMCLAARSRAERLWHPARIAALHADLYSSILSSYPSA